MSSSRSAKLLVRTVARGTLCLTLGGCMTLTTQLEATDYAKLERVAARSERDAAFRDNSLYRHEEPQGTRYTKGNVDGTPKRSWQSLDAVLRSDENSSAALPAKQLRRSRVFTGLAIASSILFVAGVAATARDGFSFREITPGNGVLLGGALGSVAFAVLAGVFFRRARVGYDRAVNVYNDSLGLRLGVMTANGDYKPAPGIMVDQDGFVITEDRGAPGGFGPNPPVPTAPVATPAPATPPASEQPLAPAPAVPPPGQALRSTPSSAPWQLTPGRPPVARRPSLLPVGALTFVPQR